MFGGSSGCEVSGKSTLVSITKCDSVPAAGTELLFTYLLGAAAEAEYRRVVLLGEKFEGCSGFEGVDVILLGELLAQRPP